MLQHLNEIDLVSLKLVKVNKLGGVGVGFEWPEKGGVYE